MERTDLEQNMDALVTEAPPLVTPEEMAAELELMKKALADQVVAGEGALDQSTADRITELKTELQTPEPPQPPEPKEEGPDDNVPTEETGPGDDGELVPIIVREGYVKDEVCRNCGGKGRVMFSILRCPKCGGSGRAQALNQKLTARIAGYKYK